MANHNLPFVFRMEMHRPAKTVLKHLAFSALPCLHPLAVAEGLETVFPDIQKIILVNVALNITAVYVGTSGNGAVNQNGADGDAGAAEIEPVADLALVRTDVGLATEFTVNPPLFSGCDNEVHHLAELCIAELKPIIGSSATNWGNSEQTPCLYLVLDEQLFHGFQLTEIHRTHTGHDIVCGKSFLIGKQVDGAEGVVKAALTFAEGVVRVA